MKAWQAKWFLAAAICLWPGQPDELVDVGLDFFRADNFIPHLEYLTSEECAGRDTPSPGLQLAADYIAKQFEAAGLKPGGDEGSYFRRWEWEISDTSEESHLILDEKGELLPFRAHLDYRIFSGGPQEEVTGEALFLGYGIEAKPFQYSDFAGEKCKDKILIVLSHEPRQKVKGRAFDGLEATTFSSLYSKAKSAEKYGAKALLVVPNPKHCADGKPLVFHAQRGRKCTDQQPLPFPIPVLSISLETAEKIVGETLLPLQEKIDESLRSTSVKIPGKKIVLFPKMEKKKVLIPNVVAIREGSDAELAKEVIVVGAHFDHVGRDDRGVIWPGADDNGSGVSVLIEIAKSYSKIPTPRTLVFVAFSGEEVGLLGSEAFVKNPPFPVEDMVGMINMDMLGREKKNEIFAAGTRECPGMEPVLARAKKRRIAGLSCKEGRGEEYFERSDQLHFVLAGVPALFFLEGNAEHEDYHCPTDTMDKIIFSKLEKAAKFIFLVVYELATGKEKPKRPQGKKK